MLCIYTYICMCMVVIALLLHTYYIILKDKGYEGNRNESRVIYREDIKNCDVIDVIPFELSPHNSLYI